MQDTKLAIHARFSDKHIDLHRQVVARAQISRRDAVLDVGCGTGAFLRYLSTRGHTGRLVGVDVADGVFRPTPARCRAVDQSRAR